MSPQITTRTAHDTATRTTAGAAPKPNKPIARPVQKMAAISQTLE